MVNLPPGLTGELWKGWIPCPCNKDTSKPQCGSVWRCCADWASEKDLSAALLVKPVDGGFRVTDDEGFGEHFQFSTEDEALAWCNEFAEKHGGWESEKD